MTKELSNLYTAWKRWADDADRSEDGWQSDFPQWDELMSAAASCMISPLCMDDAISIIEQCWAVSEETEDLADYAKEHFDQVWPSLIRLVKSNNPDVRWQVYSVLGAGGSKAYSLLRQGLNDPDSYCRRRAILSIANHDPEDAEELAQQFLSDEDPYIRQAAIELVRVSGNPSFIKAAKSYLLDDEVEHVRKSAQSLPE